MYKRARRINQLTLLCIFQVSYVWFMANKIFILDIKKQKYLALENVIYSMEEL